MSLEPALLAAVAAAPDDDLPRLVYADWLDENGRPLRAEFIRLQIEIARKETLPRAAVNAFSHLWKRQQEILDDHRDELLGPLATTLLYPDYEFRRGFLERLLLDIPSFVEHQEHLATLTPVPAVRVDGDISQLPSVLVRPRFELLTELSLSRDTWESRRVMPDTEVYQGIAVFRQETVRLRVLELENCRLGNMATELLFGYGGFSALQDLDLSFNDLTDAGVIALLNTGVPQRLKRLVLGGNPIGDQAAIELADRLGRSTVLESLNLRMTNIGPAGQAALLARLGGRVDLF